jgi:hypothetical protein
VFAPWELPADNAAVPAVAPADAAMTRRRVAEAHREPRSRAPARRLAALA